MQTPIDLDGDGFREDVDCNDDNSTIHPGAIEVNDGIDNNCDGLVDNTHRPIDLGTLGGDFGAAREINDLGQVVGSSRNAAGETHAAVWDAGTWTDLGTLGGPFSHAFSINELGQVAGTSGTASLVQRAFLWEDGTMTDLGTLGGDYSSAQAINDLGQVVGQSLTTLGVGAGFLWEDGTMTELMGLNGGFFVPRGINNLGQVVGDGAVYGGGTIPSEVHAFLWEDGTMTDLGTLGGDYSSAQAINDLGQVVGLSDTPFGEQHAFLWEVGTLTDLGTLGGPLSVAYSINDLGQVVGLSDTPFGEEHAFLWEAGRMIDLGTLGGAYSQAESINDLGQVVGIAENPSSARRATLWAGPVPTSAGMNVVSQPVDTMTGKPGPVTLTFSEITVGGVTELAMSDSANPPPFGFALGDPATYYSLTTTVTFSGSITVCIDYSGVSFSDPSQLRFFHYESGTWTDITTSVDSVNQIVCGSVTSLSPFAIFEPLDLDSDGVFDATDACRTTTGYSAYQGCPVGDRNLVTLHVIDQAKSDACPGGAGSCKSAAAGAQIKVFDRSRLDGLTITTLDGDPTILTKNPDAKLYDDIFESIEAKSQALAAPLGCTTDSSGICIAGEETIGDYLAIVKYSDSSSGKIAYTGKPKGPSDFVDTDGDGAVDLATKEFQILKVIKRDGSIQFSGGSKTVVTGSYLEIVYPDYATWEDAAAAYVYPFIFSSDSTWDVDICAQMPPGYQIRGVYDESGVVIATSECVQTFVSGQTKVVAFEVIDVGSPEPRLDARLSLLHHGTVTTLDLSVSGTRLYSDKGSTGWLTLESIGPIALPVVILLAVLLVLIRVRGRDEMLMRTHLSASELPESAIFAVGSDRDHVELHRRIGWIAEDTRSLLHSLRRGGFMVDRLSTHLQRARGLLSQHRCYEAYLELQDLRALCLGYLNLVEEHEE